MFTGIIKELGVVKILDRRSNLLRLAVAAPFANEIKIGDSISVNGVCLTAAKIENSIAHFDVMQETLKTTNFSKLKLNDKVNLEPALKASDKIGGHIVTGHVDTIGAIIKKTGSNEQAVIEISIDAKFMSGIVDKGSIAVDGISLTVAEKKSNSFIVSVIPHTLKVTTLGLKYAGDSVNIELDAMGKQASTPAKDKITEEFLHDHGF